MLAEDAVRLNLEASRYSADAGYLDIVVDHVCDSDPFRVSDEIASNFTSSRSRVERQRLAIRLLVVLFEAVARKGEHASIAEGANLPASMNWVVCPLSPSRDRISDYGMLDAS